ncbi:MAG: NUDIX domain-containing protein [Gemmatimonadaceae bacterium]
MSHSSRRPNLSAGLLMFRRGGDSGELEFFLAHPGGPFWAKREDGAWTIPKGGVEAGEEILATALREFKEETGISPSGPYVSLGSIRQRAGKVVHAWAWEGDADPASIVSNTMTTEWPRGSGRQITFPEVDRCAWFTAARARGKINAAQGELLTRLGAILDSGSAS